MWKRNIILQQKKDDGISSRTPGPAANAKIKRDVGTDLKINSSPNYYLKGVLSQVQRQAIPEAKDSGIAKDSRMTGNPYSSEPKDRTNKNFSETKFGQTLTSDTTRELLSGLSGITNIAGSFINQDPNKNPTGFQAQQTIGSVLNNINPFVGTAYNLLSTVAEATDGNINTITSSQAHDMGLSKKQRLINNIASVIPGLGWGLNKTSEGQKSHLINEMSNAYADTVSDIDVANKLGKSKFLVGGGEIEENILTANRNNQLLTDMNFTNTMLKKSDYAQDLAQQNLNRYSGTNYMNMRMGKSGMKLTELDHFKALLRNRIVEETSEIQKFAEGGSILPTGKLHKELHHMDDMGEQFEDLTRKGIPVVTMDEGGEMVQVAEIERDEICFSKEITDQLEAFWKDGSDEATIAAGKLIANEILYNTQDESNVIWAEEKQPKNS